MATVDILNEPEPFTKTYFCYSCIADGSDTALDSYIIQNEALRYMVMDSHLTLCSLCKVLARRTENFINNLLLSRPYWEGNELQTKNVIEDIKFDLKSTIKLSLRQIESVDIIPEWVNSTNNLDFDLDSPKGADYESDSGTKSLGSGDQKNIKYSSKEELVKSIKIEKKLDDSIASKGSLVAGQYQQTSNEFDIKKHMAAFSAAMKKSGKVKQARNPIQRTGKGKYKVQSLHLSREELMVERNKMAADRKYLESAFRCERCVKGFTFRSAFESHLMKHDKSNGEYECDICQQRVDSEEKLQRHQKLHYERYKCPWCGLVRACRSTIQEHIVAQHSDGQVFACPHCPKIFNRNVSRKKHVLNHHRNRPRVACQYCPKTYTTKELLKNHYANNHAAEVSEAPRRKPYECVTCDAAFTAPSLLKKHMVKHTDKKEFYCVECDKSFKSESILKTHLRVATPHVNYMQLPFACQHCEKRFPVRRGLQEHMNGTHLKIKPFQCDKCDRAYSSKCSLTKHIQFIHNGKRAAKHPCPFCEKLFDKRVLTCHLRTHTGERPYSCPHCPMTFSQPSILSTHVKLVHLKLRRDGTKKEK